MGNQFFVLARKQVDDRYFYHRVATGLLFHRGTGHANQYLSRQRRIVDMHVELEQLVLGFSGYAFACQVDAVSHVQQLVYTRYFYDVGFTASMSKAFFRIDVNPGTNASGVIRPSDKAFISGLASSI